MWSHIHGPVSDMLVEHFFVFELKTCVYKIVPRDTAQPERPGGVGRVCSPAHILCVFLSHTSRVSLSCTTRVCNGYVLAVIYAYARVSVIDSQLHPICNRFLSYDFVLVAPQLYTHDCCVPPPDFV
jgi:hypothetical protein